MSHAVFIDQAVLTLLYDTHAVIAGMLMALEGDQTKDIPY